MQRKGKYCDGKLINLCLKMTKNDYLLKKHDFESNYPFYLIYSLRIIRKIRSPQGKKHTKKNLRNIAIHLPSLLTKHIQNNVHIFHLMCT